MRKCLAIGCIWGWNLKNAARLATQWGLKLLPNPIPTEAKLLSVRTTRQPTTHCTMTTSAAEEVPNQVCRQVCHIVHVGSQTVRQPEVTTEAIQRNATRRLWRSLARHSGNWKLATYRAAAVLSLGEKCRYPQWLHCNIPAPDVSVSLVSP